MVTHIEHEIRINAPKNVVWAAVADFGGIYKFNPGVSKSYSTSSNNEGVGASRHCDLLPLGNIEERVTEWKDGEYYKLEIYDGQGLPPIENIQATIGIHEDGDAIVAYMKMQYESKLGIIGALMNAAMLKSQFTKTVEGILAGLKHYAETGEEVDRGVYKRIRAATAMA